KAARLGEGGSFAPRGRTKATRRRTESDSFEQGGLMARKQKAAKMAANRDPITDAPGAHPVGVGVGAASGAAGGAAGGPVAGPGGTAVGAVVGGVAGGLAGKGVAEAINPTVEEGYWRENYASRPYVGADERYDTYAPAYRYGWESYVPGQPFEDLEPELRRGW